MCPAEMSPAQSRLAAADAALELGPEILQEIAPQAFPEVVNFHFSQ